VKETVPQRRLASDEPKSIRLLRAVSIQVCTWRAALGGRSGQRASGAG